MKQERLEFNFPSVTKAQWLAQIEKDLKGKDPSKLSWSPAANLLVQPVYNSEDLKVPSKADIEGFPYRRTGPGNWIIQQYVANGHDARRIALESLASGIESIRLACPERAGYPVTQSAISTNGNGSVDGNDMDPNSWKEWLSGIVVDAIYLDYDLNPADTVAIRKLLKTYQETGVDGNRAKGCFGLDPISEALSTGGFRNSATAVLEDVAGLAADVFATYPGYRTFSVSGHPYHAAGADIVLSMACMLATASEYMNSMLAEDGKMTADQAALSIAFAHPVSASYFVEIAAIRAFRLLWAEISSQYGATKDARNHTLPAGFMISSENTDRIACRAFIQGMGSERSMTIYDAHNNMLRSTTSAMSAILGGCDVICNLPFDHLKSANREFSARMARNTTLILKHESHLDKVADPAGGSYYLENLTDMLAERIWQSFQKIESEGGMIAALKSGSIQATIEEQASALRNDYRNRKKIILGANQYPPQSETLLDQELSVRLQKSSLLNMDDTVKKESFTEKIPALKPFRPAEDFEKLRIASETFKNRTGRLPACILIAFGNGSMRTARSQFAQNFFGCAGYELIEPAAFENAKDAVAEIQKQPVEFVVFCSSDEEYLPFLKSIPVDTFNNCTAVVAGNPDEQTTELLKKEGISEFIHMRSKLYDTLLSFHKLAGVGETAGV